MKHYWWTLIDVDDDDYDKDLGIKNRSKIVFNAFFQPGFCTIY